MFCNSCVASYDVASNICQALFAGAKEAEGAEGAGGAERSYKDRLEVGPGINYDKVREIT